jgi:hypothetical protein
MSMSDDVIKLVEHFDANPSRERAERATSQV